MTHLQFEHIILTFMLHVELNISSSVCQKSWEIHRLEASVIFNVFFWRVESSTLPPKKNLNMYCPHKPKKWSLFQNSGVLFSDLKFWLPIFSADLSLHVLRQKVLKYPSNVQPERSLRRPGDPATFVGRGMLGGLDGWRFRRSRFFMIFRA